MKPAQKLSVFLSLAAISFPVFSVPLPLNGFYGGLQLGETNSHYESREIGLENADTRDLGFSGRAFIGYQPFEMLGMELGFIKFKDTRLLDINNGTEQGIIKEQSWDLSLHSVFPLGDHFLLAGRFGLAYLIANPSQSIQDCSTNDYKRDNIEHVRPLFALGLEYPLTVNWSVEANWLHILRHRALPQGSLISIGLIYRFFSV